MLRPRKSAGALDFAIPAINIVFLLLLFFLTAGSRSTSVETTVAPPISQRLAPDRLPRPLLTLAGDGALFLDGVPVAEADVASAIAGRRAREAGRFGALHILADQTLAASTLLDLVARLRAEPALSDMGLVIVTARPHQDGSAP